MLTLSFLTKVVMLDTRFGRADHAVPSPGGWSRVPKAGTTRPPHDTPTTRPRHVRDTSATGGLPGGRHSLRVRPAGRRHPLSPRAGARRVRPSSPSRRPEIGRDLGSSHSAPVLHEEQWAWLRTQLTNSTASAHLIVSSVQAKPLISPYLPISPHISSTSSARRSRRSLLDPS